MRFAYAQRFGAHARPLLWQSLEAAGVVLVPALVLVPVAVLRFIDVDEGSYVLTAKLVSERAQIGAPVYVFARPRE